MSKLIIYYAALKHFLWGVIILITPFELKTTTLATINAMFLNYKYAGIALILGAILAIHGARLKDKPVLLNITFLSPLIFFVLVAGFNALNQVVAGQYADGVIRPWQFILADQIHPILLMVFVLFAIFAPLRNVKYE